MEQIKCPKCGEVFTIDEAQYNTIVEQVRTKLFEEELKARLESIQKENATKNELAIIKAKEEQEKEIQALKEIISDLKNTINLLNANKEADINKARNEYVYKVKELENKLVLEEKQKQIDINALIEKYKQSIKAVEEERDYYKDLKSKLSTKMLGETLEQHCEISFNQIRATAFPYAIFHKDNEVVEGGKGDYVFKDMTQDGTEVVSILFEMKNEDDLTKSKHKVSDFFEKADKDRKNKGCEYCVIVTTLEADNELYNQGIVDVSYEYEKMYVIRPQFFVSMISLLRNAALRNIETKRELIEYQKQNIDITNFEERINAFKEDFQYNINQATAQHDKALDNINKAIDMLLKTRDAYMRSNEHLIKANDKVQGVTIRKLTYGNPTMKRLLETTKEAIENDN